MAQKTQPTATLKNFISAQQHRLDHDFSYEFHFTLLKIYLKYGPM